MSAQETPAISSPEKPNIIFIDDDPRILRSLNTIFRSSHNVYITEDPDEFREKVASIPMDVIVCDQKMPVVTGTELLAEVRQSAPDAMRILLTGYADRDDVLDAINEGEIYRYITKPWDTQDLLRTIGDATNIARALRQMRELQPLDADEEGGDARCGAMIMFENEKIYEKFRYVFERRYTPYWAKDLESALEILLEQDIGIIVSDVHFCGQDVVSAMNVLKSFFPQIMSIVVTQTQDSEALIDLINYGQVYRALVRPISTRLLSDNLRGAAIRHRVLQDSPEERARHQVDSFAAEGSDQKLKALIETIREKRAEREAARAQEAEAAEHTAEAAQPELDLGLEEVEQELNIFEPEGEETVAEVALVASDENLTLESAIGESEASVQEAAQDTTDTAAATADAQAPATDSATVAQTADDTAQPLQAEAAEKPQGLESEAPKILDDQSIADIRLADKTDQKPA